MNRFVMLVCWKKTVACAMCKVLLVSGHMILSRRINDVVYLDKIR